MGGTPVGEIEDALRAHGERGEDLPAELAVARVPVLLVRQREEVCAQRAKDIAETGPQIRKQDSAIISWRFTIPEWYVAVLEGLAANGEEVLAVSVTRREGVGPS